MLIKVMNELDILQETYKLKHIQTFQKGKAKRIY